MLVQRDAMELQIFAFVMHVRSGKRYRNFKSNCFINVFMAQLISRIAGFVSIEGKWGSFGGTRRSHHNVKNNI